MIDKGGDSRALRSDFYGGEWGIRKKVILGGGFCRASLEGRSSWRPTV